MIQCPSRVAGLNRWSHALAPSKFSGSGMVMQKGAQPRASHSPTSSHDDLANEKGPRKRPIRRVFGLAQDMRASAPRTLLVTPAASAGAIMAVWISEVLTPAI